MHKKGTVSHFHYLILKRENTIRAMQAPKPMQYFTDIPFSHNYTDNDNGERDEQEITEKQNLDVNVS